MRRFLWLCVNRESCAVLLLLAAPVVTLGGTISFGELDFTFPVLAVGGGSFVSIPGSSSAGQYTVSATLSCDNCSDVSPSPSILHLSGVQIICSNPGLSETCGPIDLEFDAQFGAGAGDVLLVQTDLSGSGDSASGFAQICVADSQHLCSSNGSGSQSINIGFNGQISGSDSSNFSLIQGFGIFGDFHLDGLPADSTGVSLTDSLSITLNAASTVKDFPPPLDTPEPATMFPFLASLVSLVALGKRRFRASR
jgi:hypothetical protein